MDLLGRSALMYAEFDLSGKQLPLHNILIALRNKAIVFSFKHWISEVFTSGDVSLHNIVISLCYKSFETCHILLWITKGDIRVYSEISNVYLRPRGWYFQIIFNEYQHWTFPEHNHKRVVTLSVMILKMSEREMISLRNIQYHFCAIYATTYTMRSYLDQIY